MSLLESEDDWDGSPFSPMRRGSWAVTSKMDPRWNMHGEGLVGGSVLPPSAAWALREKEKELKAPPPDDLEYAYTRF